MGTRPALLLAQPGLAQIRLAADGTVQNLAPDGVTLTRVLQALMLLLLLVAAVTFVLRRLQLDRVDGLVCA